MSPGVFMSLMKMTKSLKTITLKSMDEWLVNNRIRTDRIDMHVQALRRLMSTHVSMAVITIYCVYFL